MSDNRQSLGAYPCPIGIDTWCNAECAEAIDNCEAVTCLWLPVYRQAMADHRCARLLGIFERWFAGTTDWAISAIPDEEPWRDAQFERFRRHIRGALRAAGLE